MISKNVQRLGGWAAVMGVLVGACAWWESGRECEAGSTSCDGDAIRVCVVRSDVPAGSEGPQTKWKTMVTCSDDPLGPPRTCGVVSDQAQCVAKPAADIQADAQDFWLRVDVEGDGASGFGISGIAPQTLEGMPASATLGEVAAVAYAGETIVDAALVPSYDGASRASVWVRAKTVTRVDIVDPKGKVVDSLDVDETATSSSALVDRRQQALEAVMPSTVTVLGPDDFMVIPEAMARWKVSPIKAEREHLALVGAVLREVPAAAMTAIPAIMFVAQSRSPFEAETEAQDAGVGAGGAIVDVDGGLVLVDAESELVDAGPFGRVRTAFAGTTLVVDVSDRLMELYRDSAAERSTLAVELVRRVGEAYATLAIAATQPNNPFLGAAASKARKASDYPPKITAALRRRVVPLLGPLDTFEDAWGGLHGAAVKADIATSYIAPFVEAVRDDEEAVTAGFASRLGQDSITEDLATYLAYGTLSDAWSFGPCESIRAKPVDQLDPRLFVALSKLHVLWGLGVLSKEKLTNCVGELPMSEASKPGITVHLADGQRILFDEDAMGTRTAYLHTETHVTTLAGAGDVNAAVDLMYSSAEAPELARLTPVLNIRAQDVGGTFALTDDGDYADSPSKGGLLMMTTISPKAIEGMIFMAVMGGDILGAEMFPLVTIRLDEQHVEWPTVTYEGAEEFEAL